MASASGSSGQSLATARSPKSCCPLEPGPLTGSRHERTFARLSIGASVRSFFTGSRPRLRRSGAGPRDGAPRCGRRWRAVLAHPTAPHATRRRAAPRTRTRTLLSAQATITLYCADDGRGRRVPGCRKPQHSPPPRVQSSDPFGRLPCRHRSRTPPSQTGLNSLRRPARPPHAVGRQVSRGVCPPRAPGLEEEPDHAVIPMPAGARPQQPRRPRMPSQ